MIVLAVVQTEASLNPCIENSSQVRITAQQLTKDPPSYSFLVTNLTNSTIFIIVIGSGPRQWLRSSAMNVPTGIESPDGWKGSHVFAHESPYMKYMWMKEATAKGIPPGESACGFRINLPIVNYKEPLFSEDGKEVKQVDFRNVPFRISLTRGVDHCGTVTVDPSP
jgi:hypothetical protein